MSLTRLCKGFRDVSQHELNPIVRGSSGCLSASLLLDKSTGNDMGFMKCTGKQGLPWLPWIMQS